MYLGLKGSATIQSIAADMGEDHDMVVLFYTHCKDFLVECVKQIQGGLVKCIQEDIIIDAYTIFRYFVVLMSM